MSVEAAWVIALGAVAGATTRWALLELMDPGSGWPWATFGANLLGCLVLGVLVGRFGTLADSGVLVGATAGFCGALTTFSGFAVEVATFARADRWELLVAYLVLSVTGGLLAFAAGQTAARRTGPLLP